MQAFVFIAYELFEDRILGPHLAWTPSSLSVELFSRDLVRKYDRQPVWTDAGDRYPPACESINLKHHVYPYVRGSGRSSREQFRGSRIEQNRLTISFRAEPRSEMQAQAHTQQHQRLLATPSADASIIH